MDDYYYRCPLAISRGNIAVAGIAAATASAHDATTQAGGYVEAVLALSPTGYWRMGEASGSLADSSGNGLTLTAVGTATYGAAGWPVDDDGAVTFSGTQRFTCADNAAFDLGTSDYSFVWCMKVNGTPATAMIIMAHDGEGYAADWNLKLAASATLFPVCLNNAQYNLFHSATMFDNAWHHMALTCDRSALATLYLDGASVGTVSIAAQVAADLTNARPFFLGSGGSGYLPLTGSLDEVAFWGNRLLTSGEVTTLYGAR